MTLRDLTLQAVQAHNADDKLAKALAIENPGQSIKHRVAENYPRIYQALETHFRKTLGEIGGVYAMAGAVLAIDLLDRANNDIPEAVR